MSRTGLQANITLHMLDPQGKKLEDFTPTRGMMLSVFDELDSFGQGELTAKQLETAKTSKSTRAGHVLHHIADGLRYMLPQTSQFFKSSGLWL